MLASQGYQEESLLFCIKPAIFVSNTGRENIRRKKVPKELTTKTFFPLRIIRSQLTFKAAGVTVP